MLFLFLVITLRKPSHPLLKTFISHMAQGGRGHWESPLASVPRLPNHSACEMGELTQTGLSTFNILISNLSV